MPGSWRPSLPTFPSLVPRKAPTPRTVRVIKTASVALDGTGYGYCTVTTPAGVTADMVSYSFSTTEINPAVVPPQFTSYFDSSPNMSHYFESSGNGNRGSSDTTHEFLGSEPFTGEWRGGTPGSIATLRVVLKQTESIQL